MTPKATRRVSDPPRIQFVGRISGIVADMDPEVSTSHIYLLAPVAQQEEQVRYPDKAITIEIRYARAAVGTRPPAAEQDKQVAYADAPVAVEIAGYRCGIIRGEGGVR